MNGILGQIILAARRSDDRDSGWMQILIFVILGIFYAVGSIVKSKANKTAQKGEKQVPGKPGYKPPQRPTRPIPRGQPRPQVAKPQVQPPRRKVARPATARPVPYGADVTGPQPTGRKLPTKTAEAIELPTLEPLEVSKVAVPPKLEPKLEELPEFTPAASLLRSKTAGAEKQPAKYLSDILSDYDDPESLRRAILHYEILGKPLSLRDPAEKIIGL